METELAPAAKSEIENENPFVRFHVSSGIEGTFRLYHNRLNRDFNFLSILLQILKKIFIVTVTIEDVHSLSKPSNTLLMRSLMSEKICCLVVC